MVPDVFPHRYIIESLKMPNQLLSCTDHPKYQIFSENLSLDTKDTGV